MLAIWARGARKIVFAVLVSRGVDLTEYVVGKPSKFMLLLSGPAGLLHALRFLEELWIWSYGCEWRMELTLISNILEEVLLLQQRILLLLLTSDALLKGL